MKLIRLERPTLIGLLFLLLLAFLPGFTPQPEKQPFPAPLDSPALALYHNFAISGIYDFDQEAETSLASLSAEIKSFLPNNHEIATTSLSELLGSRFFRGCLRPQELYFYLRDGRTFALVIEGNFSPQELAQFLPASHFNSETGRLVKTMVLADTTLHLSIGPDRIMLYPESVTGEVESRLNEDPVALDSKFVAFSGMLKGRPALATEIDFSRLRQASSSLRLPVELGQIRHLRLIADDQLTKLQLFIPEDEKRRQVKSELNLATFSQLIPGSPELKLSESGNSLFIDTVADPDLEKSISRRFAAILLHFLIKNSSQSRFAATTIGDRHEQID